MVPQVFKTTFDEYKTIEQIGQGGTGFVVSAKAGDGSTVAIKYLNPSRAARAARKRFQNEIQFGQKTSHKNIVRILDFGVVELDSESSPFYVMPVYQSTLRKIMDKGIASSDVLDLFTRILHGVEAAHLTGVWHRDLKPENILLSADRANVVVADFGIAHFSDLEHYDAVKTQAQERLANFRYCAPEQAHQGRPVDKTADIYALGLILNEMFTGEVARGSGYRLVGATAATFAYLDEVVARMIRQDPRERFQSIDELKAQIAMLSNIAIAHQRLDALKREIVPESDIEDPIVQRPMTILKDLDWKEGRLYLTLSEPVPALWKEIFMSGNRVAMYTSSMPGSVKWTGVRQFSVPTDVNNAKAVLTQYEAHVARVNSDYINEVRNQHAARIAQEQTDRKNKATAEAQRLAVLESLKR